MHWFNMKTTWLAASLGVALAAQAAAAAEFETNSVAAAA